MKRVLLAFMGLVAVPLFLFPLTGYGAFEDSTVEQTGGPSCYQPGTATVCFTVTNNSGENGMGIVRLTFPAGWGVTCDSQDSQDSCGNDVDWSCGITDTQVEFST